MQVREEREGGRGRDGAQERVKERQREGKGGTALPKGGRDKKRQDGSMEYVMPGDSWCKKIPVGSERRST